LQANQRHAAVQDWVDSLHSLYTWSNSSIFRTQLNVLKYSTDLRLWQWVPDRRCANADDFSWQC